MMPSRLLRILGALLLLGFATPPLSAKLVTGESLEWLTDTCKSIGIYRLATVAAHGEARDQAYRISLRLAETLKGTAPETTQTIYALLRAQPEADPALGEDDEFLVFFRADETGALSGHFFINLTRWQPCYWNTYAINSRFEVLRDKAKILGTVRQRLVLHPKREPFDPKADLRAGNTVAIPGQTSAHELLWSGSGCELFIPKDLQPKK